MSIPAALTERVRAGQGVLVAGLGFLEPQTARGWEPLLRRLAERFAVAGGPGNSQHNHVDRREHARAILDLINRGHYAAAVSWLRMRLPGEAWRQALGEIPTWAGKAPEAVALAARLPWRGVIASCLPEAWAKTLKNGHVRRLDARMLAERDRLEDGVNPFLLQALGSFSDPDSLCLSAADLRRQPNMEAVANFLRALYAERSFVFVGFRPGDPDLRLILDHLLGAAPTRAEHFLLLPDRALASESDLEAEILGAELDVVPVLYPGTLEELLTTWAGHPDGDITAEVEHGAVPSEERLDPLPQSGLVDWVREQHAHIESTPVAERGLLFERMGDVYRDRLKNPVQAISYYRSALQMDPGLRSVLLKLSELYTLHKHWAGAEEMLVRLAALEQSTQKRARLLCQAAAVALDELDRPVRAAQLLERALDEAPELPEIFDTLERLLNQEKNWQALARLYQKIARELDADGPGRALKLRAMDGLAELALRFSKDPKVALKALEAADALEPHNAERKALMAQLYAQVGPGEVERAAAMHHAAIAADPDRFGSYRALADLYRSAGQRDRLWCVAATLSFLRKADEELRDVYERGRASRTGQVNQRFGGEVWARIAHPDEDRDFSALFAVLGPVLAGIQAVDGSALALRPEERAGSAFAEAPVGRALANVSYALDTPPLQVYLRASERRPVLLRIVRTGNDLVPTLILGGPLVSKTDVGEAAFTLARSLVLLRPERIVCALESGRHVARLGMEAALNLAGLKPPAEAQRNDVERLTAELTALLPTATRDLVVGGARRLIAKHGGAFPDVDRWCNAVELSAARAGFLLVNDSVLAARALAAEAGTRESLSAKQRLKDLVGFSISEGYFEARTLLGLGVTEPGTLPAGLPVLYLDELLVIVDKPSGVVVHRGWADDDGGVLVALRRQLGRKLWPLHRLDRGASGALAFALNAEAAATLGRAFAGGQVDKRYLALVRGHPPEAIRIDHPLPAGEDSGGERVAAVTEIRRLGIWERYALVEAIPHTGRLHQIRRHLKHIACPIIGDVNYGKGEHNRLFRERFGLHRLALHAVALSLPHPATGAPVTVRTAPTGPFADCLQALGFQAAISALVSA